MAMRVQPVQSIRRSLLTMLCALVWTAARSSVQLPLRPKSLPLVPVVISGEAGYPCHRIPSIVVAQNVLLAFSEARMWRNDGCYPHAAKNLPDESASNRRTDIGLKRSTDGGMTWSNLTIAVSNGMNPTAIWDSVRSRVVLQFVRGAWVMSITSTDHGRTWTQPANISSLLKGGSLPAGVVVGPGVGLQLSHRHPRAPGRLLFIGHVGYSLEYVWYSDDGGESYFLSKTTHLTNMNEAQLVELPDGRVQANMRNHHKNTSCKCRGIAFSADAGESFGNVSYDPALISPICMASILRGDAGGSARDAIFFANPASTSGRTNGTVRRSDDGGRTWGSELRVGDPFDYSSLTLTPDPETLGILWETWEPVGGKHCNGEACSIVFSSFQVH